MWSSSAATFAELSMRGVCNRESVTDSDAGRRSRSVNVSAEMLKKICINKKIIQPPVSAYIVVEKLKLHTCKGSMYSLVRAAYEQINLTLLVSSNLVTGGRRYPRWSLPLRSAEQRTPPLSGEGGTTK